MGDVPKVLLGFGVICLIAAFSRYLNDIIKGTPPLYRSSLPLVVFFIAVALIALALIFAIGEQMSKKARAS